MHMKDLECTRPFHTGLRQLGATRPPPPHRPSQTPLSLGERNRTEASELAGGPRPRQNGVNLPGQISLQPNWASHLQGRDSSAGPDCKRNAFLGVSRFPNG